MSDINAILDRHGIKRCGDSSCIFSRQLAHAVTEQAAEIARLTAELAAAREAAQRDRDVAQAMARSAHDAEEQLAAARAVPADVEAALDTWAQSEIFAAESEYEPRDSARADANRDILRTAIARAISDATAARGTVGGLLATAPVGSIVECSFMRSHRQVRAAGFESIEQRWYADGAWSDWYSLSYQFIAFQLPARLVPAAEADADPNQRGPLPTAAPRCSCTHEAGDSICDAHPSCSECGDSTSRNVDDCADHCQVCASLRRGDAITDWTATCQACKSRGPLPKGG